MVRIVFQSVQRNQRHDHASMTAGMGLLTLEDCP